MASSTSSADESPNGNTENTEAANFPLSVKRFQQLAHVGLTDNHSSGDIQTSGHKKNKSIVLNGNLNDMITTFNQAFIISDATTRDIPIRFASEGFYRMTGFTSQEVIGNNCRFLQGPETDQKELYRLRCTIELGKTYCGRLLNYKKDGSTFWNLLTICPIRDEHNKIVKYIGMQVEVTKYTEGSMDSVKRPNELPVSLIKYDARQKVEAESYADKILKDLNSIHSIHGLENETVSKNELSSISEKEKKGFSVLNQILTPNELVKTNSNFNQEEGDHLQKEREKEEEYFITVRERNTRRGMDLATTLERIQKSFVITDPRLPENPIIFASDEFLELTEYSREEVLGKNCRFLQGKDTNPSTVSEIRNAIQKKENVTVQILNYKKNGEKFWNLFHLHLVKDNQGDLEYFIGVQLDVTEHVHKDERRVSEKTMIEGTAMINEAANDITHAVKEFPDPAIPSNQLWEIHNRKIIPKPHSLNNENWKVITHVMHEYGGLELHHFRPIKSLGCGDTGSVYLVELMDTGKVFALKSMDKDVMIKTNKIQRARTEREILGFLDHPFLPTLYASFETQTHVFLVTDYCPGRELFMVVKQLPHQKMNEADARFYAAEVLLALEYLHYKGVIYRDLKPENVLLTSLGHIILTDFDLSLLAPTSSTLYGSSLHKTPNPAMSEKERKKWAREEEKRRKKEEKKRKKEEKKRKKEDSRVSNSHNHGDKSKEKSKDVNVKIKKSSQDVLHFSIQPSEFTNSLVGTEEYIAPEIVHGVKHGVQVDWWSMGIFLYELLYGKTPFRGESRNETFNNILAKDCVFPQSSNVSENAKDLIRRLLTRDPEKRLGGINGADEIKRHPFFSSMPWPLLRSMVILLRLRHLLLLRRRRLLLLLFSLFPTFFYSLVCFAFKTHFVF